MTLAWPGRAWSSGKVLSAFGRASQEPKLGSGGWESPKGHRIHSSRAVVAIEVLCQGRFGPPRGRLRSVGDIFGRHARRMGITGI